jgi:hypothetical protein
MQGQATRKSGYFNTRIASVTRADGDKFYSLFGRCINAWSFIDQIFCTFFSFALQTDDTRAAIVYYSYNNFGFRQAMTEKLMAVALADDALKKHRKDWAEIIKEVNRLLPMRNDLAHEPIRERMTAKIKLGQKETHAV